MARFVDPARVLDDLEQQVKLELARRELEQRFDDHICEQIDKALEGEPLEALSDAVIHLAHSIQEELSRIWLPEGDPCTTQNPTP